MSTRPGTTSPPTELPADPRLVLLARALDGDVAALETLIDDPSPTLGHRIVPALAARAREQEIEAPTAWQQERYRSAAHHLLLDNALGDVTRRLGEAGVVFAPLKGNDLAHRLYVSSEERPSGDVDLLIDAAGFERARETLLQGGWRALADDPLSDRYLRDEGYAWQAVGRDAVLLELHLRLWGLVPESLASSLLADAEPDPDLGVTARRLSPQAAFVIAAVHTWLEPPTRPMLRWWELERLATTFPALVDSVPPLARRFDLQLPVLLAAAVAGSAWPECTPLHGIAEALVDDLRFTERRVLARARRHGAVDLPLGTLVLARLLAGRRSRAGWRSVWRRLWPHPAIVARATPAEWGWPRRRVSLLWHGLTGSPP